MLTYAYVCIFEEVSLPKISSFKNVPHKRFLELSWSVHISKFIRFFRLIVRWYTKRELYQPSVV